MRPRKRDRQSRGLSNETMRRELRIRLESLRQRGYDELSGLPERATEEVVVERTGARVTIYREGCPPGPLKVVAQFSTDPQPFLRFLSSSQVVAEGFRAYPDGTIEEMAEKELHTWM